MVFIFLCHFFLWNRKKKNIHFCIYKLLYYWMVSDRFVISKKENFFFSLFLIWFSRDSFWLIFNYNIALLVSVWNEASCYCLSWKSSPVEWELDFEGDNHDQIPSESENWLNLCPWCLFFSHHKNIWKKKTTKYN